MPSVHPSEQTPFIGKAALRDQNATRSKLYIYILVLGIGGLQFVWAVELSNGSPYLQSLGISKALLSLVWIAGPISGTLVQPLIGLASDECHTRLGKRTPFIWAGVLCTVVTVLLLAWAGEIVQYVAAIGHVSPDSQATAVKWFAIISVYMLDFSINTVQASLRALIVDCVPTHQQEFANAAAGQLISLGNVFANLTAKSELPATFWFLGREQFQILAAIACLTLCASVSVSTIYIKEWTVEAVRATRIGSFSGLFCQILVSLKRLPPRTSKVCIVQSLQWFGWFPFLFYITTYIGQLYVNPIFEQYPLLSSEEIEIYWAEGTRKGAQAMLVFAMTSFLAVIILPLVVAESHIGPPNSDREDSSLSPNTDNPRDAVEPRDADLTSDRLVGEAGLITRWSVSAHRLKWLTLRRAWLLSQLVFVACMAATFLVESFVSGTVLVGIIGISWAMTQWAPFAFISAEIRKIQEEDECRRETNTDCRDCSEYNGVLQDHSKQDDETIDSRESRAGVILGIHNMAVAAPQIIAALIASLVFQVAQKPRGEPEDESTAWVLRLGGMATLAAALVTYSMHEEGYSTTEEDTRIQRDESLI